MTKKDKEDIAILVYRASIKTKLVIAEAKIQYYTEKCTARDLLKIEINALKSLLKIYKLEA